MNKSETENNGEKPTTQKCRAEFLRLKSVNTWQINYIRIVFLLLL